MACPKHHPPALRTHLRAMVRFDLHDVLGLEEESGQALPWDAEDFTYVLAQDRRFRCLAAEYRNQLIGYAVAAVDRRQTELVKVVVDRRWRLRGVGKALTWALLPGSRCQRLFACVNEQDMGTLKFLRACGWEAVKVVRGYYGKDDGFVLEARGR